MDFTDEEKKIIRYMYENANSVANLIDNGLNGYGLTPNDIYTLFEKLGVTDILYG